ncbi:MAG TPA: RNA 3'-terminal phosphate cyclase [Planctomycetaceae bacterium]|nr:RNA 3'-terminal phosphate cyclase [Planctomycetaceae bacterium]
MKTDLTESVQIDGALGEGGGQVLRTSLALSMMTGRAVELVNIRAGRKKPGLMRQHLACVRAAQQVCDAKVTGDELGSAQLTFEPGPVSPGDYRFRVGLAGSTSLVLQTVFPALANCHEHSRIQVEGGTHNPLAPCTDFLQKVYAPAVARFGMHLSVECDRYGFAPAGGGLIIAEISPLTELKGVQWIDRLGKPHVRASVLISQLDSLIASREAKVIARRMNLDIEDVEIVQAESSGPGNCVILSAEYENCFELVSEPGRLGTKAERVARAATNKLRAFFGSPAPIGEHLADQLMLPAALAAASGDASQLQVYRWTAHCQTHQSVLEAFLPIRFETQTSEKAVLVTVVPT